MDNYILLPEEKKTLKAMRGKASVPPENIYNWKSLYQNGFIQKNCIDERDGMNVPIHDGTYRLSEKYWRYTEASRTEWIWRFIPIAISVVAIIISLLK